MTATIKVPFHDPDSRMRQTRSVHYVAKDHGLNLSGAILGISAESQVSPTERERSPCFCQPTAPLERHKKPYHVRVQLCSASSSDEEVTGRGKSLHWSLGACVRPVAHGLSNRQ